MIFQLQNRKQQSAFTLLEVAIAMGIFFTAIFAILDLTSQSIRAARNLQPTVIDATTLAAELSITNRLTEGPIPIEIVRNFELMHPGFTCSGNITERATNGLFQVDFLITGVNANQKAIESQASILLFRPLSQPSQMGGLRR
ncbi:MAG: hypothetical protein SFY81_02040 [Verrucomicrobiota bacterium]|nr:hypothetical protein [Verrucomicrobiota bacterium]